MSNAIGILADVGSKDKVQKLSKSSTAPPHGAELIEAILRTADEQVNKAIEDRDALNKSRRAKGLQGKGPVNRRLAYSIAFGRELSRRIAQRLAVDFGAEYVKYGEVQSATANGERRVDVSYSTPQRGLGLMVSLKSVHEGERASKTQRFTHNLGRNDAELRVEAAALHIRQPFAVLVAVMVLPFEACEDAWTGPAHAIVTSSFARWVEKFWLLKGRDEPEDPVDRFELVFLALYAKDGSGFGFYEVGGPESCPRSGRPNLLTFEAFIRRATDVYLRRNSRDFAFAGEQPKREPSPDEDNGGEEDGIDGEEDGYSDDDD
jgi:hypothetical protein